MPNHTVDVSPQCGTGWTMHMVHPVVCHASGFRGVLTLLVPAVSVVVCTWIPQVQIHHAAEHAYGALLQTTLPVPASPVPW